MSGTDRRRKVDVSVVVPVFNEEACLEELIDRTVSACEAAPFSWEFILVDDASSDASPALIERAVAAHPGAIRGVFLTRNYGQHAAVMAGLSESAGDVVVTLDADLQNPPEEIPRLVAKIGEGCDVVGGVRQSRDDSLFRRVASRLVNVVVRRMTGSAISDYGCMLRAYRRPVVNAMLSCPEHSTFIPVLANMFARHVAEIPVAHAAREGGRSKYGLWKLVNLQFDLLTCVSVVPLQLLTLLGVLISIGSFAFGLALIVMRFAFGAEWAADGVFTLFAILFLFVGVQFVAMGVLGEYLGRIYIDVRSRPRWLVQRVVGRGDGREGGAAEGDGRREPSIELFGRQTPEARVP